MLREKALFGDMAFDIVRSLWTNEMTPDQLKEKYKIKDGINQTIKHLDLYL